MDRFIACQGNKIDPSVVNLKSNMDRFIAPLTLYVVRVKLEFKIQYG